MTHKVHPKAFRIKGMEDFNIRGFYGNKMPQYLEEDFLIKDFLRDKLSEASVANIEIEHSASKLNIIIETARPGLIIGRGGEGVEILKKAIEQKLKNLRKTSIGAALKSQVGQVKIDIKEIKNPWISAMLVAQMAAQQIEKRIPFRQVLKRSIERVMQNKEVKGIKMEVSGRLNGIEIARKEWLKQGRMPLQTIRADIDYAQTEAYCTYGAIGVKVWLYKGEKFE
ncbi:MAG: 30S ribosomal protein S3 [Candidatus Staskawiczbacteria bacterium RIFCSPLOWO2_01_FULL_40_39]|uniref:Small ribosomal subunit protein uS3 n=1 Tax=Candidatus Staskawiczbacteria bacterium RIFCSPHIGHO2_01_FULL_39_25 TaxID=1802202 RepID=A0A1G2HRY6_9BACT|nr:MAG: 30S ribosomal protein S3 [Candidatus Staskawiczbacteria bacterium RIFCSPHIGHO2_01_FULL_39_25]OGZ72656.1 MAG: 30S ribosomal protein S3 [Candidatus Staskawiczbacteria bacterium RIFCSPLOWO2_01_FULL_40_39]OGZ76699.1 MAG: 30S ribosomal protein S3 [Candidatus Staskawiczbacteria bacterium RIFCSPLOWO2_02_FULL_39_8]